MCLIAIATRIHPRYPLIIGANRDEFYHRPTAALAFWQDHPGVLAGRDLQQNGTWLGLTRSGRFAAITNFREPAFTDPRAPSRGLLVSDFLVSDQSPENYLNTIKHSGKSYNGFNLAVGDLNRLWWYSNRKNDIVEMPPGVHVISNHLMDTPWPKVRKTMTRMQDICCENTPVDPEDIFRMLADANRPPDDQLPDTGVGLEWERILSSVFVSSDIYGTRSSAVIIADTAGQVTFLERTYEPGGETPVTEETRSFNIQTCK